MISPVDGSVYVERSFATHAEIAAVYRELRRRGPDDQGALLELLQHDDAGVRLWAAAHALEFAPERGEPVAIEGHLNLREAAAEVVAHVRQRTHGPELRLHEIRRFAQQTQIVCKDPHLQRRLQRE